MPMTKELALKHGATPFSNAMVDKLMPRLRDTEWRLLCLIVRQTIGRSAGDGTHKIADWMSHSQLRRKTGRSSAAISVAIEFLCRNNLIEVADKQGHQLRTAAERRIHRGRLYFAAKTSVHTGEGIPRRFASRNQKLETTTKEKSAVVVRAKKKKRSTGNHQLQGGSKWKELGKMLHSKARQQGERP